MYELRSVSAVADYRSLTILVSALQLIKALCMAADAHYNERLAVSPSSQHTNTHIHTPIHLAPLTPPPHPPATPIQLLPSSSLCPLNAHHLKIPVERGKTHPFTLKFVKQSLIDV